MQEGEIAKAGLRTRLLAARAALPTASRVEASAAVCARLAGLRELLGARAVLGYAAFGAELDIDAFLLGLLERDIEVFLPRVDGSELTIAGVADLTADLAPGWRGVREPRARGRPARPDRIDAVVAPGVAFDTRGRRLGYGGGHFDRLLARLRPGVPVVGVGFDEQVIAEVPVEPHDRLVDVVVTPTRVLRA